MNAAPEQQGLMVLGTPLGSAAYVQAALQSKREAHDALLDKIPGVPDMQSAWLLLLLCGATRANYWLRVLPPQTTLEFARRHDAAVVRCLADLLANDVPHTLDTPAMRRAHLLLAMGGLGLRSAVNGRYAAYWASWADTLPTLQARHPHAVADIGLSLSGAIGPIAAQAPSTVALAEAASHLQCRASLSRRGKFWLVVVAPPRPSAAASSATRCAVGSVRWRPVWTQWRLRAFSVTSIRHLAPSLCHKRAPVGREPSSPCPQLQNSASLATVCGCSCFGA